MQGRKCGFELVTLGHLLKRERDRANDEIKQRVLGTNHNIMCNDLGIIKFLVDNGNKEVYQKDIEQYFSLTAPSVSNKLRELEKNGLINRIYSKVDTRLKQVIITEKGHEIFIKIRDEIEGFEDRISNLLTDDEKDQLINIVDKLKKEFE